MVMLDRHRPLAAFVDAVAAHLARVLNVPATAIVPLVRLNTLHRKPNQGVFVVAVKALAQLTTLETTTTASKTAALDDHQIHQCLQLDAHDGDNGKLGPLVVSARHVKELLHFDPDPVQILQLSVQSVQREYKASQPSSSSTETTTVTPATRGKRSRASSETILVNGTLLKHDEDPYTSLRRIIMTALMANLQRSQHPGAVKVFLENNVSSMDERLARLVRGLDVEKSTVLDDPASPSLQPHLTTLQQLLTAHKALERTQKDDKSWHVDLSGVGLHSIKIYNTTADDGSMEGPALATQVLAMFLAHFEQHPSCETYIWVVSEGRQMLASQVLYLAEKLFTGWAKKVQVIPIGLASGPDIWKENSQLPSGVLGILASAVSQTRQVVQEKEEKISEALEGEDSDQVFDEASLEKMVIALAHSAVVMSCLSNRRSKRLALNIDSTVTKRGNTGVFLQYVYARLCGIERKANVPLDFEAELQLLKQHSESVNLALAIAEWPEMLLKFDETQDPFVLSNYLFALASEVGQANRVLRVKGMEPKLAKARWLLFWAAKYRLAQGLQLCGLDLVERM